MYRIMIVEDDEVIARAVQQSLVSWGMDAFCVQDFSSVLAEFAVKNPQLVLMDIHLPSYYIVVVFIDPLQGLYAILFGDTVDWFHLPTT